MKEINGEVYLKIGKVAELIGRTPLTIKNWYEWAELHDCLGELPKMERVGKRGVRYYREDDLYKLIRFRNSIRYGSMSEYNEQKWGDRNIGDKRSVPFEIEGK